MRFEIILEKFVKALSISQKAISAKATLPVLGNVLLEADKGRLKISATDLERSISVWVGAKIIEDGAITVPAKILYEFSSSLKNTQVSIFSEKGFLIIEADGIHSKIAGMAPEEFPKLPQEENGIEICEIPSKLLLDAVSKVSFSSASEDSRPILTGIQISINENNITAVAVDGFRLAEITFNLANPLKSERRFVVPAKSLAEICRVAYQSGELSKIGIFEADNMIYISGDDIFTTIKLLEGDFPDYQKIIPSDFVSKAKFVASDFSQCIKTAGVFAKDESRITKISLNSSQKELCVSSQTQEVGEFVAKIKADCQGEDLVLAFNARFLGEFLGALGDLEEELELSSLGALSPALFVPSKATNYRYVVMPVRISA
jgi:DNA polymerase-3 subunit beta